MKLDYAVAEEIAKLYGLNWNLDLKWQEQWFENFTNLLYQTFKGYDQGLVHSACMQFIQDSTATKAPPFGVLKSFLIAKLGAAQMERRLSDSTCPSCEKGSRRLLLILRLNEDRYARREYVTRCTCERGSIATKSMNFKQFMTLLKDKTKIHAVLGFDKRTYPLIEVLNWEVSFYNSISERDEYRKGLDQTVIQQDYIDRYDPYPFGGMTGAQIEEEMNRRKKKMTEKNLAARKKVFRQAISRGRY
jgi:hypothetical protein